MPRRSTSLSLFRRLFWRGGVALWLSWTLLAHSQEIRLNDPRTLIAGYIRNLPSFVEWPTNTFASAEQAWRVGVVGPNPFSDTTGDILEAVLRNRKAAGRTFEIWHAPTPQDLPPCEMLFFALKDEDEISKMINELGDRPVLTVAERANFLEAGGIIELRRRQTVQIAINLDRARALHLKISPKLLEIASEVLENGTRRKLKR